MIATLVPAGKVPALRRHMKMKTQTYPIVNGSAAGRFFVDESCIYCEFCVETAPRNFSYDTAGEFAYISAQPSTQDELDQVAEALEGCPTESIGDRDNYRPNSMPGNRLDGGSSD